MVDIVVCVDGSEAGRNAVRWAARDEHRRDALPRQVWLIARLWSGSSCGYREASS
jgi:hypothetical protein